jgi:hypothetical protein
VKYQLSGFARYRLLLTSNQHELTQILAAQQTYVIPYTLKSPAQPARRGGRMPSELQREAI